MARPIDALIWCVRNGLGRYGGYPNGSLEKFRVFMGVHISDPVLHVCAGLVRQYKYVERAVGPNDKTMDLDPSTHPDYLQDARKPWPTGFKAAIADPDYSLLDATKAKRPSGAGSLPTPNELLKCAYVALEPGRRFGILHTKIPSIKDDRWISVVSCDVKMGGNNVVRTFTVLERR